MPFPERFRISGGILARSNNSTGYAQAYYHRLVPDKMEILYLGI